MLDAWMCAREPRGADGGISESTRWLESYARLVGRATEPSATRLRQVGNRESDILTFMQGAQTLDWPVDILVRLKHNRSLPEGALLWDEVQASKPIGEIEFTFAARAGRRARVVRQELQLKRVTLHLGEANDVIEMTCLVASEIGAPASESPCAGGC